MQRRSTSPVAGIVAAATPAGWHEQPRCPTIGLDMPRGGLPLLPALCLKRLACRRRRLLAPTCNAIATRAPAPALKPNQASRRLVAAPLGAIPPGRRGLADRPQCFTPVPANVGSLARPVTTVVARMAISFTVYLVEVDGWRRMRMWTNIRMHGHYSWG